MTSDCDSDPSDFQFFKSTNEIVNESSDDFSSDEDKLCRKIEQKKSCKTPTKQLSKHKRVTKSSKSLNTVKNNSNINKKKAGKINIKLPHSSPNRQFLSSDIICVSSSSSYETSSDEKPSFIKTKKSLSSKVCVRSSSEASSDEKPSVKKTKKNKKLEKRNISVRSRNETLSDKKTLFIKTEEKQPSLSKNIVSDSSSYGTSSDENLLHIKTANNQQSLPDYVCVSSSNEIISDEETSSSIKTKDSTIFKPLKKECVNTKDLDSESSSDKYTTAVNINNSKKRRRSKYVVLSDSDNDTSTAAPISYSSLKNKKAKKAKIYTSPKRIKEKNRSSNIEASLSDENKDEYSNQKKLKKKRNCREKEPKKDKPKKSVQETKEFKSTVLNVPGAEESLEIDACLLEDFSGKSFTERLYTIPAHIPLVGEKDYKLDYLIKKWDSEHFTGDDVLNDLRNRIDKISSHFEKIKDKDPSVEKGLSKPENFLGPFLPSWEEIKKLQNLRIIVDWMLPPVHQELSHFSILGKSLQFYRNYLTEKNIKFTVGHFNSREEKILYENWKRFQNEYGLHDIRPLISVNSTKIIKDSGKICCSQTPYISKLQRKNFILYMGQNLPDRLLDSIFYRLKFLCKSMTPKGIVKCQRKTTAFEVAQIKYLLKHFQTTMCTIETILGNRTSIEYNYIFKEYLSTNLIPIQVGKWTRKEELRLLKGVSKIIDGGKSNILEGKLPKGWKNVFHIVQTREDNKCNRKWLHSIEKFKKSSRRKKLLEINNEEKWELENDIKLIEKVYEESPQSLEEINFNRLCKINFPKFNGAYLKGAFISLINTRVDSKMRVDFEESLEHLFDVIKPMLEEKVKRKKEEEREVEKLNLPSTLREIVPFVVSNTANHDEEVDLRIKNKYIKRKKEASECQITDDEIQTKTKDAKKVKYKPPKSIQSNIVSSSSGNNKSRKISNCVDSSSEYETSDNENNSSVISDEDENISTEEVQLLFEKYQQIKSESVDLVSDDEEIFDSVQISQDEYDMIKDQGFE